MNNEETLKDIQQRVTNLEEHKSSAETQQISLPLDDVSKTIITELIPDEATQVETNAGTATRGKKRLYVNPSTLETAVASYGYYAFGGDGSDGALTVSSGTTDIDLDNATVFVKNYSSISITGTGAITFSNPNANGTVIIFRCSGDVTITTSATRAIDLRSLGGVPASSSGQGVNGQEGSYGNSTLFRVKAGGGGDTTGGTAGTGGIGGLSPFGMTVSSTGVISATTTAGSLYSLSYLGPFILGCGAGGGSGASSANTTTNGFGGGGGGASVVNSGTAGTTRATTGGGAKNTTSGSGGRGGGALLIECAGALNITGTIDAAGGVGGNGGGNGGAGGGGGGGGTIVILYRTLTANTGTYTITGGGPGQGADGGAESDGGTGGDGASLVAAYKP